MFKCTVGVVLFSVAFFFMNIVVCRWTVATRLTRKIIECTETPKKRGLLLTKPLAVFEQGAT